MTGPRHPTRLAIPLCVERADEIAPAVRRAVRFADLIELRLDCLDADERLKALQALPSLLAKAKEESIPFILTLRPPEQGGYGSALSLNARLDFWLDWFRQERWENTLTDIEFDLLVPLREKAERSGVALKWERLICSQHDFAGVPVDLERLYERMAETPARVLKIAYRAQDITDCLAVFKLLARAQQDGRELIAIAMGAAGVMTRVLAPSHGGFLTFGALAESSPTAPGQLTAEALRQMYRLAQLDEDTQVSGLIGTPVAHSFSPQMHNAAFAALDLNAVYLPFEVAAVGPFLRRMVKPRTRELRWNLRGLSVTAPHKQAVLEHLDGIDEPAREIGAVNTILVEGDELRGFNTDAAAVLAPFVGSDLREARVAVLGAGGAARSVLWSLRQRGADVTVFGRSPERAQVLARQFGAVAAAFSGARFNEFNLVINTTPLGTTGHQQDDTPAVAAQLQGAGAAYDLVYNPAETRFMREAHAAGCPLVLGGLPMLVAQAAAQFELWTGCAAPRAVMHAAAAANLSETESPEG